jgi:hypothetical protein
MLDPETTLVRVVEIPKASRNEYEYDPQLGDALAEIATAAERAAGRPQDP